MTVRIVHFYADKTLQKIRKLDNIAPYAMDLQIFYADGGEGLAAQHLQIFDSQSLQPLPFALHEKFD